MYPTVVVNDNLIRLQGKMFCVKPVKVRLLQFSQKMIRLQCITKVERRENTTLGNYLKLHVSSNHSSNNIYVNIQLGQP